MATPCYRLMLEVPTQLNAKQREALEAFEEASKEHGPLGAAFIERMKKLLGLRRSPSIPSWVEVVVRGRRGGIEALTNFLWEHGAVGVVEESLAGTPGRLRAFFPVGSDHRHAGRARRTSTSTVLRALGLDAGARAPGRAAGRRRLERRVA